MKLSLPFLPQAQHSSFCCLSAQTGLSSEANHHSALLPCCHQLSLFLGNITLSCVTMATQGHHLVECNRETGGKGKEQSRSEPLLIAIHFPGGFFPFYGRGNWGTDLNVKPDSHALHLGLSSPVDRKRTEPFISTSVQREANKQASRYTRERVGALVWCRWTKQSLDIYINVLHAAPLTTFCIFFQLYISSLNVSSFAFPAPLTCELHSVPSFSPPNCISVKKTYPFSFKCFVRGILLTQKINNLA